jgi:hypothetical protein
MLAASVLVLLVLLVGGCSDPDTAIFARLSEADQARFRTGRQVAVPCWTCHDLAGTVKKVGPSLLGVYGRKSGRAPEYVGSPAMLSASIVWDDRMLSCESGGLHTGQSDGFARSSECFCASEFALLS